MSDADRQPRARIGHRPSRPGHRDGTAYWLGRSGRRVDRPSVVPSGCCAVLSSRRNRPICNSAPAWCNGPRPWRAVVVTEAGGNRRLLREGSATAPGGCEIRCQRGGAGRRPQHPASARVHRWRTGSRRSDPHRPKIEPSHQTERSAQRSIPTRSSRPSTPPRDMKALVHTRKPGPPRGAVRGGPGCFAGVGQQGSVRLPGCPPGGRSFLPSRFRTVRGSRRTFAS
jgi:hypothetical protein